MQHWQTVLEYLRKQKDEYSFYPVSLDEIAEDLFPNMGRVEIHETLKGLEESGDVLAESIPNHPKTWTALT